MAVCVGVTVETILAIELTIVTICFMITMIKGVDRRVLALPYLASMIWLILMLAIPRWRFNVNNLHQQIHDDDAARHHPPTAGNASAPTAFDDE